MDIISTGKVIDTIEVSISYRIIELFSGGLYSSPHKAFEELVCNSYDAFADNVNVYISQDLAVDNAYIWVCDNGEGMNDQDFKTLWKIGESLKRDGIRDKKRLQIGRFGIGKLSTYILANYLTYLCKKDGRFLAVTMNYSLISDSDTEMLLDEREISEKDAEAILKPYIEVDGKKMTSFEMFGDNAVDSWTFSIMTNLKPKAKEIKINRLKWILSTALPLNPSFNLFLNGSQIESSKIDKPLMKKWIIGKDDITANNLDFAESTVREIDAETKIYSVNFDNLNNVNGVFELYEDTLVDQTKSSKLGRSNGIFLMVRGRLINLDDPLLGLDALMHGAFNRSRIIINADGLDDNITSTRENIKDSLPLSQVKDYIKKKFNNEVKKYYVDKELKKEESKSIANRLSMTSLTISKSPLLAFVRKYYNEEISNPYLIEKPDPEKKEVLISNLEKELAEKETFIKNIKWDIKDSVQSLAKLNLHSGIITINLSHPYIANYFDSYKNTLPLEFIAITEVLTEAHLYELGIDEANVNIIMHRRDITLRELALSERESAPAVAQMLKDSLSDEIGLENAVHNALLALGFESISIGGNGKPDGIATAVLGYSHEENNESYKLTFDAKSTGKKSIMASTANLATIKKHQNDYEADFSLVVAKEYQGSDDPESNISIISKQQKVTVMKASDLYRLLLLSAPKQIGLDKLKELFTNCYAPEDITIWVDNIQNEKVDRGPVKELLEVIYELQKTDIEPPDISSVRRELLRIIGRQITSNEIKKIIESLETFVPGFIRLENTKIGIQSTPEIILTTIKTQINEIPSDLTQIYLDAFSEQNKPPTGDDL